MLLSGAGIAAIVGFTMLDIEQAREIERLMHASDASETPAAVAGEPAAATLGSASR